MARCPVMAVSLKAETDIKYRNVEYGSFPVVVAGLPV